MKLYHLLIILTLILLIKNESFCDFTITATGPKDCNNLRCSTEYNQCCYFEGTWNGANKKACIDLSPARKDDIDNYIKEINANANANFNVEKIVCNSFFIEFKYISFLLLFLL